MMREVGKGRQALMSYWHSRLKNDIQTVRKTKAMAYFYHVPQFSHTECDKFIIKLMNDYLTPRRRHSSLFQRMEDEINKISRKLSAAKQHREAHTPLHYTKPTASTRHESPGLTVRRAKEEAPSTSKQLTRKWTGLMERQNMDPKRPPIRRLRFSHLAQQVQNTNDPNYDSWMKQQQREQQQRAQRQALKRLQEKRLLEEQLSKMNAICQEQAFKLGFLRAQNKEISTQLQSQRIDSFRQQLYLGKLVDGYKIKINKYKQILHEDKTVEIDIRDL